MGAPELPGDPGEEDLRPPQHIHHDIMSDDSDNESMTDAYDGYQQLNTEDGMMTMDNNLMDEDETELEEHTTINNIDAEYDISALEPSDLQGDPNLPQVESADAEIERQIWSEPRPQELQIELDNTRTAQILNVMSSFTLPNVSIPEWAAGVPEERWKEELLQRIRMRKETPTSQVSMTTASSSNETSN